MKLVARVERDAEVMIKSLVDRHGGEQFFIQAALDLIVTLTAMQDEGQRVVIVNDKDVATPLAPVTPKSPPKQYVHQGWTTLRVVQVLIIVAVLAALTAGLVVTWLA